MSVIGELATEPQPVVVELPPKLADSAGRKAISPRQIQGALAHRHVADKAAVTVSAGP